MKPLFFIAAFFILIIIAFQITFYNVPNIVSGELKLFIWPMKGLIEA